MPEERINTGSFFSSLVALPPQQKTLFTMHVSLLFVAATVLRYSRHSSCFRRFILIRFFFLYDALDILLACYINVLPLLSDGILPSFIRTLRKQNVTQSKSCATHLHFYHCSFFRSVSLFFLVVVVVFSSFRGKGPHLISCSKKGTRNFDKK